MWQFFLGLLFYHAPMVGLLDLVSPLGSSRGLPRATWGLPLLWFWFAEDRVVLGSIFWLSGFPSFVLGHFFLLGVGLGLDMKWTEVSRSLWPHNNNNNNNNNNKKKQNKTKSNPFSATTTNPKTRDNLWQGKPRSPTSTNGPTPAYDDLNPTCANLNPPTTSHDHQNATTQPEITNSERGRPRWGKKNREIEKEKKAELVSLVVWSVGWREREKGGVWD